MEKEIDYNRLGDIAIELANSINKIKEKEKNIEDLLKRIETTEEYQGKDAATIMVDYRLKLNNTLKYMENMEAWKDYTKTLAGLYKETKEEAVRDLGEPLIEETNKEEENTLNLESPIVQEQENLETHEEIVEDENGYEL